MTTHLHYSRTSLMNIFRAVIICRFATGTSNIATSFYLSPLTLSLACDIKFFVETAGFFSNFHPECDAQPR